MRTMYDAVDATQIPADVAMVAGYLDGPESQWQPSDWARFPAAVKVGIVVNSHTDDGHVLDVEQGDAPPEHAPTWVQMRRAAGTDPTVYCNLSTWPAVRAAFQAAGVAEPHYWIAHFGAPQEIPDGAVALQYAADVAGQGSYDMSCVADYWPGVDDGQTIQPVEQDAAQPSSPAPAPTPAAPAPSPLSAQVAALEAQVAQLQGENAALTAKISKAQAALA